LRDVVRYWQELNKGCDCVFGSRFLKGGGVIDYPFIKLKINRLANLFLRLLFGIKLNDTTNAFKPIAAKSSKAAARSSPALQPHRRVAPQGHRPRLLLDRHPITWRNRRTGVAKLKSKRWAAATSSSASSLARKVFQPRRLSKTD